MVAFVDDQMAVIGDQVANFSIAHETLYQRYVDASGRLELSTKRDPISATDLIQWTCRGSSCADFLDKHPNEHGKQQ